MREALYENVVWKTHEIQYSTYRLVHFFASGLSSFGTTDWGHTYEYCLRQVNASEEQDLPLPFRLDAEGFSLLLVSPRLIGSTVDDADDLVVFRQEEPRVRVLDQSYANLSPSQRNRLYDVTEQIADEMSDVYGLYIQRRPLAFVFPKDLYAEKISIQRIVLIDPI